jgi:hypothetical protein
MSVTVRAAISSIDRSTVHSVTYLLVYCVLISDVFMRRVETMRTKKELKTVETARKYRSIEVLDRKGDI